VNTTIDESHAIAEVTARLVTRFPAVPAATVRATVKAAHREFTDRPVRDFVPVLVERQARQALTRHAA
jgi:hypothetical protein